MAVVLAACGENPIESHQTAAPAGGESADATVTAVDGESDDESDDGLDAQAEPELDADDPTATAEPAAEPEPQPEAAPSPEPAPATVDDPCAGHENRTSDVFIEVAAPVDGQQVGPAIDLVGCSNIFEAAVRYRLSQGGNVLVDSFTTSDCGHGFCVGEFSASVDASGASSGPLTLQVFWDDASDGTERDVTQLSLVMP